MGVTDLVEPAELETLRPYLPRASEPAENAVLSAAMISPEATLAVVSSASEDWFSSAKNRLIFRAIKSAHEDGIAVDLTTIWERLKREEDVDVLYLANLDEFVGSVENVESYLADLRDNVIRRRVARACMAAIRDSATAKSAVELVHATQAHLLDIEASATSSASWISLAESVDIAAEEALGRKRGQLPGVGSGIKLLDRLTGGFPKGSLTLIGGRPGQGKTALALQCALHAGREHGPVAFVSIEMAHEELAMRALSGPSAVSVGHLKVGGLSETQRGLLVSATRKLAGTKVWVDDSPGVTVDEIEARCRVLQREHGLAAVFIDYLGLIQPSLRTDNLVAQMTDISRRVTGMAKRLGVPVIALSQLSRKCESREDKRPIPSDLRESGSLEQDAYLILFVYRDEVYNPGVDVGSAELILAKNRGGPTGTVRCHFDGARSLFLPEDSRR